MYWSIINTGPIEAHESVAIIVGDQVLDLPERVGVFAIVNTAVKNVLGRPTTRIRGIMDGQEYPYPEPPRGIVFDGKEILFSDIPNFRALTIQRDGEKPRPPIFRIPETYNRDM